MEINTLASKPDTHLALPGQPVQLFQPRPRDSSLQDAIVLLGIDVQRLFIHGNITLAFASDTPFMLVRLGNVAVAIPGGAIGIIIHIVLV
jgi:hypothetical protein